MKRVNDIRSLKPIKVEKSGIYVGPAGDSRYFKAGAQVTRDYQFSHQRGERPAEKAGK